MTKISLKTEYISRIGTFRPSDRTILSNAFNDETNLPIAMDAVKEFVKEWQRADWLESYSLERIGNWIAKHHQSAAIDLSRWARTRNHPARQAFLKGLEKTNELIDA